MTSSSCRHQIIETLNFESIDFGEFQNDNDPLLIPKKQYLISDDEEIVLPRVEDCLPQMEVKSTNTKYQDCYHNTEVLLTPMYMLHSLLRSKQKQKSKRPISKVGWVKFVSAHKDVHAYINDAMKNKSICKSCAIKLFLNTKGLTDLFESIVYIVDTNGIIKRNNPCRHSLCFLYVIYSSLIVSFIAQHPNIMRFIFKEYDNRLQKQIVFVIIELHKHIKDYIYHHRKACQKKGWFFYSIEDVLIIFNLLSRVLTKYYLYWKRNDVVFDKQIGLAMLDSSISYFEFMFANMPENAFFHSVFVESVGVINCMHFEREINSTVMDLLHKYTKKYSQIDLDQSEHMRRISMYMQSLLLACNDSEIGEYYRKKCQQFVKRLSIKHINGHTYCQRNKCHKNKLKQQLKLCSNCRTVYYCSKRCQKIAWKYEHKQRCAKLKLFQFFKESRHICFKKKKKN
eukprot:213853_1